MEYNKKEGIGKKFVEGILLSFEIMGLFMLLQLLISFVGVMAATVAGIILSEGDMVQTQHIVMDIVMDSNFMTMLTVVATFVSLIFSLSAYWIIWGRKRTAEDRQFFRKKVLRMRTFSMIVIGSCGLYYLSILIVGLIMIFNPEVMENYNEMMEFALGGNEVLAIFAAVILAPINEECIMRGLILKNLQKYFSEPVVIILQAIMFGIFHANWVQGIYAIPIGAALGYVAVKCKSVLPCIFMHLFYNSLSFVVGMLPEFCQTGVFAIGTIVVSAVVVLYLGKAGKTENDS